MQDLLTTCLTPQVLIKQHSLMGDSPCVWNSSGVQLHGIFSQWDLSIRQVCLACLRMCAYLRRLRYCTNEYSSKGNRCRKSKVRYDIQKIPRLCFKEPRKRATISKYSCIVLSNNLHILASLCAYYYPKSWVCTRQLPRMSSCCVLIVFCIFCMCDGTESAEPKPHQRARPKSSFARSGSLEIMTNFSLLAAVDSLQFWICDLVILSKKHIWDNHSTT